MPSTGDRRSRERHGIIEQYITLTYNVLRRYEPETMGVVAEPQETMAAAA